SPDAPSQVARAVSVARGQWLGPPVPGPSADITTYVTVPATYLDPGLLPHCYMFKENVTAACAPSPHESGRLVRTTTHVGRYPPAYYAAVGWPSRFTNAVAGLYLLQAASAVVCGALLALAMTSARRWSSSTWLVPAIAVGATPMCLFLASQVNPSGMEAASAIAVWASATILVTEHLDRPPKGLLAVLVVATALMVWTRPTALAWPLVVAAVLGPMAWRRLGRRALLSPEVLAASALLVLVAAGAIAWALLAHATSVGPNFGPLPASSSLRHVIFFVVGRLPSLVQQAVGNFGWLDTPLPWYLVALWASLVVLLIGGAAAVGPKKAVPSVLLMVAACFAVPVALLVAAAHSYGYVGQGRYFLAIWAGGPIVAAGAIAYQGRDGRHALPRPLPVGALPLVIAAAVGAAQLFSFYWALRRYTVGIPGPLFWSGEARSPKGQLQWHPPVPAWWLLGLFAGLCALYGTTVWRASARPARDRSAGSHAEGVEGNDHTPVAISPTATAQF
ncbi:MAG TPA: DUF2142 domain-containing protein, partial [Acidimicrobiales bacterium]|nr:DUF2142 domain-containing protein [Acidimicrobiales bacterium]